MASRRRRPKALAVQATELALAVPQVMTQRIARMAAAGHTPNARDRREFMLMGSEKIAAFQESWVAMAAEAWRIQQQFVLSWFSSLMSPWALLRPPRGPSKAQLHRAAISVLGHGVAPVHRRAVANAKRLARPLAAGRRR